MGTIKNVAAGPRGIHTVAGFAMIEPGASITAELSEAERKSADSTGYFEFDVVEPEAPADDGLDAMTVADLTELAAAEGVDLAGITLKADIIAAIRAKRAPSE